MQTATVINPPIQYNQRSIQVPTDDTRVRLEAPRYVFCIGDFIEAGDKRQLRSVGGWAGGLKIGNSETEGAPTMWRSNYIINRACFTPMETVATKAKADIDTKADSRFPGVYQVGEDEWVRQIFPGNDIIHLTDASFQEMGLVEISQLADTPFDLGVAQSLNRHFFPELDNWLGGKEAFPVLISDYITIIQKAPIETDAQAVTQNEMLESARNFTRYAEAQIEKNYQAIQRSRLTDMGGYGVKWSARTKLFAEQLGRTLEEDIASQIIPVDTKAKELELQEEANRLKREELEFLKAKWEMEAKQKEATKKDK
jgi:hypothetical protein